MAFILASKRVAPLMISFASRMQFLVTAAFKEDIGRSRRQTERHSKISRDRLPLIGRLIRMAQWTFCSIRMIFSDSLIPFCMRTTFGSDGVIETALNKYYPVNLTQTVAVFIRIGLAQAGYSNQMVCRVKSATPRLRRMGCQTLIK